MSGAAERIRNLIRRSGPIPFDRFMNEALYGAGGFYEHPPVGPTGHFVTSPHVHPVFSRLVGAAVEELWHRLGRPVPLRVVELGAGDGTMAREIADGFGRAGIEIDYVAVEISPGARATLADRGLRAVERLDQVERLEPGVVVANELLDNLPFRRARRRSGRVVEVTVGLDGNRLVELETGWEGGGPDPVPPEGGEVIVPTGARRCVDELTSALGTGYALLIDYGATPEGSEVHGYRAHRVVRDLLEDPGSADVTAGVDFAAIAARAEARGLGSLELVTQRAALLALGFEHWFHDERRHQVELIEAGQGARAVRVWDGRSRARLLVDPVGLGRLRWLVLATTGLPSPAWYERACEIDVGAG
jgi:NADH dehydrogenase [ubiquinone] 1 alpha subcomplex assembly factor 7